MQTLWNVHPTCSGSNIAEGLSCYLFRNLYSLDDFVLLFIRSENKTPPSEHQTKELNENKENEHEREE